MNLTDDDLTVLHAVLTPPGATPLPDHALRKAARFFCDLVVLLVDDMARRDGGTVDKGRI